MMFPDKYSNKKTFKELSQLNEINSELLNLNMKKKEISDKIVDISKKGKSKINELEIEKLFNDLSLVERKIIDLEENKNELVKNLKNTLQESSSMMDNFERFCNYNGIISVTGPPNSGKMEMIFKFLEYCTFRDHVIIALKDIDKIQKMVNDYKIDAEIVKVNPIYSSKKMDIKNLDQVSKMATKLANDMLKILSNKKNPIIVVHRSNDLSLDRINEISNLLKEEFWSDFINYLSPNKNNYLVIFNCDEFENECMNLISFSDFLVKTVMDESGNSTFYITKMRL